MERDAQRSYVPKLRSLRQLFDLADAGFVLVVLYEKNGKRGGVIYAHDRQEMRRVFAFYVGYAGAQSALDTGYRASVQRLLYSQFQKIGGYRACPRRYAKPRLPAAKVGSQFIVDLGPEDGSALCPIDRLFTTGNLKTIHLSNGV